MLSFEKLKEFFILLATFGVIYWFQYVDDKKASKKREDIYDKIKLPLLATAIVGLILFWEKENFLAIFIAQEKCNNNLENQIINIPEINKLPEVININKTIPDFRGGNIDLDVYTELFE
jgi:preprotein translocase subunit YajC